MLSVMIAACGCAGTAAGSAAGGGQEAAQAQADAAVRDAAAAENSAPAENKTAPEAGVTAENGAAAEDGLSAEKAVTAETAAAAESGTTAGTGAEAAPAEENGAAAAAEISPEDISVTWEDSRVYPELTLGRYTVITTYGVKGYEDVPFIKASDYLDILFEGKQKISVEDGVMKVSVRETEAVIDPDTDTIRFGDSIGLRSSGAIDGAIIEEDEYNVITASVKNESVQTDANPVVISLKEYHFTGLKKAGTL